MSQKSPKDPFFGLKYIAFLRTGLPLSEEDLDEKAMINFAKWQICKVRNYLWNDPVWDDYTPQELLIEYFAIKFDENEKMRKDFENSMVVTRKSDLDWFERMEAKMAKEAENSKSDKISTEGEAAKEPEEFEEKY